jgi:hypothetical protein
MSICNENAYKYNQSSKRSDILGHFSSKELIIEVIEREFGSQPNHLIKNNKITWDEFEIELSNRYLEYLDSKFTK